jgi:hypothetical protein
MLTFPSPSTSALFSSQNATVNGWAIDFTNGNNRDSHGRSATLTSATNNGVSGVRITSNGAIVSFPSAAQQIGQMNDFTVYWMGRITVWQAAYSKLITVPWNSAYSSPFTQFSLGRNNGTNGALFGFGNLAGSGFTDIVTTATDFYRLDAIPHLYAVTRSGSTWSFYRDGVLIESQTASTQVIGYNNPGFLTAPVNICNNISTLTTETTRVASVAKAGVIKRALTADELKAIYVNASGLHPHTLGWYDRHVEQASTAPSATEYGAVNTYIRGLITDGYLSENRHSTSLIKEIYLLSGISTYSALTAKLIAFPTNNGILTFQNFVSGDYSSASGLDPGATNTTKNILTGTIPSSLFSTTSQGTLFAWVGTNGTDNGIAIGSRSNNPRFILQPRDSLNSANFNCYSSAGGDLVAVANTDSTGGVIGTRTSDTDARMWRAGSQVGATQTTARTGLLSGVTSQIAVFSTFGTTSSSYYSRPIKLAGCSDLGLSNPANFTTRTNALLSALGA